MSDENKISLEQRLRELEELLNKLESGELNIDEAVESYAKGMSMASDIRKMLDDMIKRVEEISDSIKPGASPDEERL